MEMHLTKNSKLNENDLVSESREIRLRFKAGIS